jgi:cytochrome d ubiquinol oxidase subunit II
VIALGIGVAFGNLIEGIPLDSAGNFRATFSSFFNPYACLIGLLSISLLMMHGAIFLLMKTEKALYTQVRKLAFTATFLFIAMYLITTLATLIFYPHMTERMRDNPVLFIVPLLALLAIANIPREITKKRNWRAFLSSCVGILFFMALFGIGTYPYLVRSTINTEAHSLTIFNSASSLLTLKVVMIIVVIGVPLVLAYGYYIYRTFRGKVKIDEASY